MIPGVRGGLISSAFARDVLPTMAEAVGVPPPIASALASWSLRIERTLGMTSSVRAIVDVAILPLLDLLELTVERRTDEGERCVLHICAGATRALVIVSEWGEPLERMWRSSVIHAIAGDARWCVCSNGRAVRVVDARRTWSRDYLEFDCSLVGREPLTQQLLWTVLRADAISGDSPLIDRVVDLSRRHGVQVCRVLGDGVLEALALLVGTLAAGTRPAAMPVLFEQSLTVLYRVLFLLFAEARGLLPVWHPVYRDRYSLDTIVTALLRGQRYRGLWLAVQAISRLAHAGCSAGELRVTAFNGRLFSPVAGGRVRSHTDRRCGDGPGRRRGEHDADPRHVHKDVPDERPWPRAHRLPRPRRRATGRGLRARARVRALRPAPRSCERVRSESRAAPSTHRARSPASWFGRRWRPLVKGRSAEEILRLRILDPAMGSGAFLVAACRYLSVVAEEALIEEGTWHAHDVTAADRAALRREVASRCLFGVDLNPMAVQLARLSLWLATLATDKPLSFLDHHLVTGNSLVGASPDDLRRQPGGGVARGRRHEELPLFPEESLSAVVEHAIRIRLRLTLEPDDTAAIVREKERTLAALHARDSSLATWSRLLDLWCAGWFWSNGAPPDRGTFRELTARLLESSVCVA